MVVGGQDRAEAEEALEDGEEEEEEDTTTALVKFTIRGYTYYTDVFELLAYPYLSLTQ